MNSSLPTVELAPGLNITRVLTGLWQIADMERDGMALPAGAAAAHMSQYVEAGFTTFDMADHYGSAEIIAGTCRQSVAPMPVQLLTKWVPTPGAITRAQTREAVARALNRLQVEQIDLMQFHAWHFAHPYWLDCLFYLKELKEEGLIRHLGTTNFDTAHLQIATASGIPIVSNQVCYSLLDQRAAGTMTDFCLKAGIQLLAFGTLAGGLLSDRWLNQPEPAPRQLKTWSQMKYKRFIDAAGGWQHFQQLLQSLHAVGQSADRSIAHIAARYMLQQPAVAGIIVGARLGESSHIADNTSVFDFTLSREQLSLIQSALAKLTPIPGDCGDEYRKPPYLTASGDLSHHLESFPPPYPSRVTPTGSTIALSGTTWESLAGFSRATRRGNTITISGTTATHGDRAIGVGDAGVQTHYIIDKIEGALQSLGASLQDVVRTRIFIRHMDDWEAVARAHGNRFKDIQPANTLVRADLVGEEYLVEIEADAIIVP